MRLDGGQPPKEPAKIATNTCGIPCTRAGSPLFGIIFTMSLGTINYPISLVVPRSNDTPFLTPPPYGFLLSQKEYDDFRTILAHSIKLTLLGEEEFELQRDKINSLLAEDNGMSAEMKEAFAAAVNKVLGDLDEDLLKIPTRNHFPSADEE